MLSIPNIEIIDILLGIPYLFIIYYFSYLFKENKIKNNPEYKYFMFALSVKLMGGLSFALYSIYYYKGGDTFFFYEAADNLRTLLITDFGKALNVYFTSAQTFALNQPNFAPEYNPIVWTEDIHSIVKITALINLISLGSYLIATLVFAYLSFLGLWFGYTNFCKLYPNICKTMLIPFFLIPSALIWSSGILKDTIAIGAIGWLLYSYPNIFVLKRKIWFSILVCIIALLTLLLIKPYILMVLFPSLIIWAPIDRFGVSYDRYLQLFIKPIFVLILLLILFLFTQFVSDDIRKYNSDNIENTLKEFQTWHTYLANKDNQSGYTLGKITFTPVGLLKKVPEAFVVTFFRPFLWETRNVSTLLGAVEGFLLLLYCSYLIITLRLHFFLIIVKNNTILFLTVFAIIFGVMVGLSAYNFGALSRYKIPATLFFILSLILIQHRNKQNPTNN